MKSKLLQGDARDYERISSEESPETHGRSGDGSALIRIGADT